MLRHPHNTNLHLHHDDTFEGLPVMVEKGPSSGNICPA